MTTHPRHTKTKLRMGLVPRARVPARAARAAPPRASAARAKISHEEEQLLFRGFLDPAPARTSKPRGRRARRA